MRVIGGTVPEPGNSIWVLVYLPRDDLAPVEFFVLTSSDLHTLLKPVQDAWLKKCQEQHGGPMPGVYGVRRGEVVIMSTPSTTIAAPLVQEDSSEARYMARYTMSSGLPKRPMGMRGKRLLRSTGLARSHFMRSGVSIGPGQMALQRTCFGPN